jgi:hypothetical protein
MQQRQPSLLAGLRSKQRKGRGGGLSCQERLLAVLLCWLLLVLLMVVVLLYKGSARACLMREDVLPAAG